jgi:GNAT superfamily N-acetyltransferase
MIRRCDNHDFDQILSIINDGALAYKGIIPSDRWKEPYMSKGDLEHEIKDGVGFSGWEEHEQLLGVMGAQDVQDVCLIRHAYVRTKNRNQGIGSRLISHFKELTQRPILIGTWADATWAIRFYERHGFRMVDARQKDSLLRRYWKIPERQIDTSVVLTDMNSRDLCLPEFRDSPATNGQVHEIEFVTCLRIVCGLHSLRSLVPVCPPSWLSLQQHGSLARHTCDLRLESGRYPRGLGRKVDV